MTIAKAAAGPSKPSATIFRFAKLRLRQRVAVDMTNRSTASKMIGQDVSMPVALAPVGMTGMQCADGEIKAAHAAAAFGVPLPCQPCR